jgi:hypothetical protein
MDPDIPVVNGSENRKQYEHKEPKCSDEASPGAQRWSATHDVPCRQEDGSNDRHDGVTKGHVSDIARFDDSPCGGDAHNQYREPTTPRQSDYRKS